MLLFLLATSWLIFLRSYIYLEDREVEQNVKRALSGLSSDMAQLNTEVGDYAGWDESYQFIRNGNLEYVKTNLDDEIFPKLRIDLLLFVNPSGEIIYEKGIDKRSGKRISLESFHPYVSRDSRLVRHETPESVMSGFLLLPEGPLLVVSRPILTSQFKGPVRGALIMGRFLDSVELNRLRKITHLDIRLSSIHDPHVASEIRTILESSDTDRNIWIHRLSPDEIAGYSLINDISGKPALLLKVQVPRSVYRQGVITIFYFILWVAGLGLVAAVAGYLLYIRLVHSRKKERESEARYHAVVKQASEGIILVDAVDKNILEVNTALTELLGYSKTELTGMNLNDIFAGDPADLSMDVDQVRARKQQFLGERRFRRKNGDLLIVEISANIISGEKCEILCMVVRDITERKRAEQELKEKKEQLELLNSTLEQRVLEEVAKNREKDIILIQQNRQAALGEMLDHIAHQWKQPLTTISLTVQLLEEAYLRGELTDKVVEESVGKTESLVQHMAQTIAVFRDFYRPDKKKKEFNIKDSIDMALSFIAPALRFDSIVVDLEADPQLSAVGYPKEFTQVLLNILANARDALNETKPAKPWLKIRGVAEGNKAVVTITDNAGGIPEAIIGKIFDPYFSTKGANGGTGVGLYMSKNIIEKNMEGRLGVRQIDNGAEFRIEVPCSFSPPK
jgi:PAS domain S-box-containing protein